MVVVINTLMKFIVRIFTLQEKHETQTKMNVSVALKLTLARFVNSALILTIVNDNAENWFAPGNLAYDAQILIVIMSFQAPIMNLIYIPGWIKKYKIMKEKGKGEDCKITQREANILCEGFAMDPANIISNFMNLIMVSSFFSPIIPLAIPLACLSATMEYWITKYNLLRNYKRPDQFGELMATFFANAMPYLVLCWAISAFSFFLKLYENSILI